MFFWLIFTPNFGEDFQFDSYFCKWVGSTTNQSVNCLFVRDQTLRNVRMVILKDSRYSSALFGLVI